MIEYIFSAIFCFLCGFCVGGVVATLFYNERISENANNRNKSNK